MIQIRLRVMKRFGAVVLLSGLLAGCVTAPGHIEPGKISRITVGMTKEQVLNTIGPPESAAATTGSETLYYVEERPWWQWSRIQVKLVDGKVTEFGQVH